MYNKKNHFDNQVYEFKYRASHGRNTLVLHSKLVGI